MGKNETGGWRTPLLKLFFVSEIMMLSVIALGGTGKAETPHRRITVIFNNIPYAAQLRTGWGFSCVVEGFDQTILFDTGGDGKILLANMEHLGIDPTTIDVVVLSHIHSDHTGGLEALLRKNPEVTVYLPHSFPHSFQQRIKRLGADVVMVNGPMRLFDGVHSTGEMGDWIKEQALILDTSKGLVIVTGCAHPGVVNIVRKARQYLKKDVYLTMGGFHLMGIGTSQLRKHIQALRALGVEKVAPSHCTGEAAIARFREAWGDDFLSGGCGAVIELYP
jgi:7,8-dihydropterin-6-yl-methyl-4-(beta-D-ribofuranosyl)aminobenzene 5'-phosphate synthase